MVNDVYLRSEFPAPGKARAPRPGDTPVDRFHNRVSALSKAIDEMQQAFTAISDVIADDGRPLVDSRGVDYRICSEWRDGLRKIDEELVVWGRAFKRAFGAGSSSAPRKDSVDGGDADPFDDRDDGADVSDPELRNDWVEQDSQTENKLHA